MLMLHSSERDTEIAAVTQLNVADKCGRLVVWAAGAESRAMSMPSDREGEWFHTRGAKTILNFFKY